MPRRILFLWLTGIVTSSFLLLLAIQPRIAGLLANTLLLVVGAVVIAVPVGTFLALAIIKTNMPGRRLAFVLIAAMLLLPVYLFAAAWEAGFGMQGWYTLTTNPHLATQPLLTGWRAAVWVHALTAMPWVTLIMGASLSTIQPELEEDALLHTSAASVLMWVSLRRTLSALLAAVLWVTIAVSTEIGVTDLFQVRTFAEEVYTQSALGNLQPMPNEFQSDSADLGLSGLLIGLLLAAGLAGALLKAVGRVVPNYLEPPSRPHWIGDFGGFRWLVSVSVWMCLLFVVLVPLGNLIYKAGILVKEIDGDRVRSWSLLKVITLVGAAPGDHCRELSQSALLAIISATIAVVLGAWLAWSMRGQSKTPWIRIMALAMCLTIPGPILGLLVIQALNHPAGSLLTPLTWLYDETDFAPCLVQSLKALPIATLVLWTAFASVSETTLDSAKCEGVGSLGRFLFIALPQRWPAMIGAWLLAAAVAMGELAATLMVLRPGTKTISVQIFSFLHYGVEDRVAAICLFMIGGIALLTILAAALLQSRRVGTTNQKKLSSTDGRCPPYKRISF